MRTYDEAFDAAHDRSAFSNGDEGYSWMANWCDRCVHDRSSRTDEAPDPANNGLRGCALVAVSMMDRTPVEWIDKTADGHRLGDTYHCTEFRDESDGSAEPEPIPVVDGQLDIVDVYLDTAISELTKAPEVAR